MSENRLRTSDFDVATFFVYNGFDYKIEVVDRTVYFIFEGDNIDELLKKFPESNVNKIISIFFGLKKVAGTVLKGDA